jgi:hypothetical protein
MLKLTLSLVLLMTLASCGKTQQKEDSCGMVCEVSQFTLDTTETGPVPPEALQFDTDLVLLNFNTDQANKIQEAAELIKRIVASQEFKDAVVNFTYNGKKQYVDNNGLTNLQIYNRLIIGAEQLHPDKNNRMDVELELYSDYNSSTVGYTYPNTTHIWMNLKYFSVYEPYQVAGNLMHEWIHKLGFTHDAASTPSRPYSVPYAIGYIVRNLAANYN